MNFYSNMFYFVIEMNCETGVPWLSKAFQKAVSSNSMFSILAELGYHLGSFEVFCFFIFLF